MTLDCFKCGKKLEPAIKEAWLAVPFNQPYAGTTFVTHGHYGSTVFDPAGTGNKFLELNICDECLLANTEQIRYGYSRSEVKYDYSPWDPEAEY